MTSSHKWKLPIWVVLIIIGGIIVLVAKSFIFGDGLSGSVFRQVGIWTASAIFVWWAWHQFKLSRALDWVARHSPLRRVPKTIAIVIVAAVLFFTLSGLTVLFLFFIDAPPKEPSLTYSEFKTAALNREIGKYIILKRKEKIMGNPRQIAFFLDLKDGLKKWTYFEDAPPSLPPASPQDWLDQLEYNVELQDSFPLGNILMQTFQGVAMTIPVFFIMWIFMGGGLRTMGEELSTLTVSRRLVGKKVTFEDVAGIDHVKDTLQEYLDYLRDPKFFRKFDGKLMKGVLLHGPSGVGKTLAARAVAGEAGIPVFAISGSDFHFAFVGVGGARAERLFAHAIRNAPALVIINELDSAAPKRGGVDLGGGATRERDSLVNKLNDIFDRLDYEDIPVIIIATTNLIEAIDPALLRDGRFDNKIYVPMPDVEGRHAILKVHLIDPKPSLIAKDIDLDELVRITRDLSGAKLANISNRARIAAARRVKRETEEKQKDPNSKIIVREQICQADILEAYELVLLGHETHVDLSKDERDRRDYHECGHGLTSFVLSGADPSEYVTTKTYSGSLGHALPMPERDYHLESKTRLLSRVKMILAGYAIEVVRFGEPSTGANEDLVKATVLVRYIVFKGMDDEIGPVVIDALKGDFGPMEQGASALISRGHERVATIINECKEEMYEFFRRDEEMQVIEKMVEMLRASKTKTLKRAQLEAIIPEEMRKRRTAKV